MLRSLVFLSVFLGSSLPGTAFQGPQTAAATDSPPVIRAVKARALSKTGARYQIGSIVRLYAVEGSGEGDVASGKIRITSSSQGFDSGSQPLLIPAGTVLPVREEDRNYFHWDTAGLKPGSDYRVAVSLTDRAGHTTTNSSLKLTLGPRPPVSTHLVATTDLVVPARGMPVVITRSYVADSGFQGPLGFRWSHSYLMHVEEAADGLVKVFNADGSGSFFKPASGGTYQSPRGDFRTLTRQPDGSCHLRTTSGTVFEFSQGVLTQIRDRNGNTTTLLRGAGGRLEQITDPSGGVTAFAFDSLGRLVRIVDPAQRQLLYGYDARGDLRTFTDPAGARTNYFYDRQHHLTRIVDPGNRSTTFAVDAEERLISVSLAGGINRLTFQYADKVPEVRVTDARGRQTRIGYAGEGPPMRVVDPLGSVIRMTYDADFNLLGVTDGNGHTASFAYDGQGNVVESTDALGRRVLFTYEPVFSQMTGMTTATGSQVAFGYDAAGNLRTVSYPDTSTEELSYDAFGSVTTKKDRLGRFISYDYEDRGLLTTKHYPDGTSATYEYDERGNLISAANENGAVGWTYDAADRVAKVTYPGGETAPYTYDPAGTLDSFKYPDGTLLRYARDSAGRVTSIRDADGGIVAAYLYSDTSQVLRKTLGNGVLATYDYDVAGHLSTLVNKADDGVVSRFAYQYDKAGNRRTVTTPEGVTTYTYDAADQLTKVVLPNGFTTSYDFDANGNRRARTTNGGVTEYVSNLLDQYTRVGPDTYTYDLNGNLIGKATPAGAWTYAYDSENRLTSVHSPLDTVTYSYDALGRRVGRSCMHGSAHYFHALGQVVLEVDQSGQSTSYVYGPRLDELLAMRRPEGEYYVSHDGLGSVTNLTDASGAIVGSFSYDSYGAPRIAGTISSPYLFTGREYDSDTGLYYYRARYYDPGTGRFLTPDPLGLAGGFNRYTYVGNNPVNFIDPLGLLPSGAGFPPIPPVMPPPGAGSPPPPPPDDGGSNDDGIIDPPPGGGHSDDIRPPEGWGAGDPTFIQVAPHDGMPTRHPGDCRTGAARISVPPAGAMVRGQVPVFGVACGEGFRSYRVEYGVGRAPEQWELIATSSLAEEKDESSALYDDPSGDLTIHGNLATWDTGLKSYVYLPTYPADHPIDLNGVYTLRLVVTLEDGRTLEDQVAVEVGEVIPNAWGGTVTSPDGKVILTVPEQALTSSFRVISIKPGEAPALRLPPGSHAAGGVYEMRQPGEHFTRAATLTMPADSPSRRSVIYACPEAGARCRPLPSQQITATTVTAELSELDRFYVVGLSEGAAAAQSRPSAGAPRAPVDPGFLVRDTFENDLGGWSNRNGFAGGRTSLDSAAGATRCLKVTHPLGAGNFGVNVVKGPFDVREFPLVEFSYRIAPGVKTDFYVKVDDRWYQIGFTGDLKDWAYRRVNIASLGRIPGIVADDRWHTARFNLGEMLRTRTAHHIMDEMVMANWDLGGFMKLEYGNNPQGAAYYIDDFAILRERRDGPEGGPWVFTGSSGAAQLAAASGTPADGSSFELKFDVSRPGAYAGYATPMNGLDLRGYGALSFAIRPSSAGQDLRVGLKDRRGTESKVRVSELLGSRLEPGWQTVTIPLATFGEPGLARLDNVSFAVENGFSSAGSIILRDVAFTKAVPRLVVDTFDREEPLNRLRSSRRTFATGAAAASGGIVESEGNRFYRLAYGGNIGEIKPYGGDLFSYAGWATGLGSLDGSGFQSLSFRIRGAKGGEAPHVYLDDGNHRWPVEIEPVTTAWQKVSIPLARFAEAGVDLSHLVELQVVFEWQPMSGTVYLDDIELVSETGSGNEQFAGTGTEGTRP